MPIARLPNGKLIYFAHAPKCAGTAVEAYLTQRFGRLGLLDEAFGFRGPRDAWSLSPPQHMPEVVRRDLLPDILFDGLFATVRHPALRLRSVFLFQRDIEHALHAHVRFEDWLDTVARTLILDPYALHGHLRPMADFVPMGATVFRIEDGLEALVGWLDDMAGDEEGPREIVPANVLADRLGANAPEPPPLTPAVCARIAEIYAVDYARFGYGEAPDLPANRSVAPMEEPAESICAAADVDLPEPDSDEASGDFIAFVDEIEEEPGSEIEETSADDAQEENAEADPLGDAGVEHAQEDVQDPFEPDPSWVGSDTSLPRPD